MLVRFLALYIVLYCIATLHLLPFVEALQAHWWRGSASRPSALRRCSAKRAMELRVVAPGREIVATLRCQPLPLLTRGFHWDNETPYNR